MIFLTPLITIKNNASLIMLQWKDIDTVLLDMDGTLLDLHFDNHFWLEHLPKRYAEINNLPFAEVKEELDKRFAELFGKLEWYCLDYWGRELQLDLPSLKREIAHLIKMRQDVPAFLTALQKAGKRIVLVTNAHPDSLSLKIERTELNKYIDELVSTHEFGVTKESLMLWELLQTKLDFDNERTLFIDDSLPILSTAKQFGVKHLVAVANPDSKMASRIIDDFMAIEHFDEFTEQLTKEIVYQLK